jgi:hypothetical protein
MKRLNNAIYCRLDLSDIVFSIRDLLVTRVGGIPRGGRSDPYSAYRGRDQPSCPFLSWKPRGLTFQASVIHLALYENLHPCFGNEPHCGGPTFGVAQLMPGNAGGGDLNQLVFPNDRPGRHSTGRATQQPVSGNEPHIRSAFLDGPERSDPGFILHRRKIFAAKR